MVRKMSSAFISFIIFNSNFPQNKDSTQMSSVHKLKVVNQMNLNTIEDLSRV